MHDFPAVVDYAIGIDNGLAGAIAILRLTGTKSLSIRDTPVVKSLRMPKWLTQEDQRKLIKGKLKPEPKSGDDYDFNSMARLAISLRSRIGDAKIVAVMEAPQMRRGPGGAAQSSQKVLRSMQHGQSCWHLALRMGQVPLFEVASATWKADLGLTKKGKEGSMSLAQSLFKNSRFDRDDQAEAALLAHWLQKFYDPILLRT